MAAVEHAVSNTEEEAEETGVEIPRKKGGDSKLTKLHFGIARNF